MSETLTITEGESPLMTFRVKQRLPSGGTTAFDLTGNTEIRFIVKEDRDSPTVLFQYTKTATQIAVVSLGANPTDEYSVLTVQFDPADTATPRNLWYRLVIEKGARKDVVKKGILEIENA
jgi:hypothetical protein